MHTIIPNIVKAKIKEYNAIQRGPHMQKEVHKHQE